MTLAQANRLIFSRYARLLAGIAEDPFSEDPFSSDPRLSLKNLAWMCAEGARGGHEMPDDKASRWLGFVQGCMAMRGLIDVDVERDFTRPLFHAVAGEIRPTLAIPEQKSDKAAP